MDASKLSRWTACNYVSLSPLTFCLLPLALPQPVNVILVNVSSIMMTPMMEILMVSMMTLLTTGDLSVMMVTGSQGTGPRLFPLSASLE